MAHSVLSAVGLGEAGLDEGAACSDGLQRPGPCSGGTAAVSSGSGSSTSCY